jgi:large repetitive protein
MTLTGPASGTGWSCSSSGATITCTRSDVLPAGSDYPPISIPVLVGTSTPPGQLSNTATLQAPSDGNPDNNSFTDSGAVSEPVIDLHVEKVVTSTPDFTPVGYLHFLDPITYRITVTNKGVADAANVQLADTFEAPLLLDSLTPSQGSCSGTVCNLGTITSDQAPVTIDVQLSIANSFDTYPSNALLNNTATVSAPAGTEINPDDNRASAAISTVPWAETSIVKAFSPAQPAAGGPVTYTLTVHSDGPGTVDFVVADILPEALQKPPTAISISGGTGVCRYEPTAESLDLPPDEQIPIVFCDIPQLGPGEDRVITIESTLAPDSAGTPVDNLALSSNTLPFAGASASSPTSRTTTISPRSRRAPLTSGSRRRGSRAARCPWAARRCSAWWRATTSAPTSCPGPASRCATRCPSA